MTFAELLGTAQDAMTVRRVFGEPIDRDGTTFIPVARVLGGGGGGGGHDDQGGTGEGGGFGLQARPAGAFVIRGGEVKWQPAVDPNVVIATAGALAIAVLMTVSRARRRK